MQPLAAFEFATATRILFGSGTLAKLPALLEELGIEHAMFVTGRDRERSASIRAACEANFWLTVLSVSGEPSVEFVRDAAKQFDLAGCDGVVAFGGGSVIDTAKAVAALAANGGEPLDYLEVVGRGQALSKPSLPLIAIPTTAGTGAEVTRNAVLSSSAERIKASLRSPYMLPRLALIDPDMLASCPPAVLRASGLDALSQLIEPFLSARANPVSDALAREGLRRSARSLRRAVEQGPDAAARDDLAIASLFGGLCLANAGLGAVHGFAAPIGGLFEAPHGAVCAALLPHVLEVNLHALSERAPDHPARARYAELATLLSGEPHAEDMRAVSWVSELCAALEVPGLSSYGMSGADLPALIENAKKASSMRANPIVLSDAELTEIATRAL